MEIFFVPEQVTRTRPARPETVRPLTRDFDGPTSEGPSRLGPMVDCALAPVLVRPGGRDRDRPIRRAARDRRLDAIQRRPFRSGFLTLRREHGFDPRAVCGASPRSAEGGTTIDGPTSTRTTSRPASPKPRGRPGCEASLRKSSAVDPTSPAGPATSPGADPVDAADHRRQRRPLLSNRVGPGRRHRAGRSIRPLRRPADPGCGPARADRRSAQSRRVRLPGYAPRPGDSPAAQRRRALGRHARSREPSRVVDRRRGGAAGREPASDSSPGSTTAPRRWRRP